MKVSFSLSKNAKPKPSQQAPALKKPAVFAALEDDTPDIPDSGNLDANKRLAAQNVSAEMSKATRKKVAAEMKVDATVYEYDEVYDKMQAAKAKQKEKKEVDSKERKVSHFMPYRDEHRLIHNYSLNTSVAYSTLLRRVDWTISERRKR